MLTLTVSRRQALIVALMVLIGAFWLVRDDQARAGIIPPGEGIDVVYLAVSTNFPDSLGVGPGAGVNAGPILLVPTDPPIPGFTKAELVRLDPKKVVIVGGTAVISLAMQAAVEALLPNATVERLAGSNRYETNTLFTQSVYPVEAWASVSAPAFTTNSPDTDDAVINTNVAYNSTTGLLHATIQLPDGAEILELKIAAVDGEGGNINATLYRVQASSVQIVAEVATSGASGLQTPSTTTIADAYAIVDNSTSAYSILILGAESSTRHLRAVMVRYRLGTPGP
ncbi:MAG TPA: cell wall-binding repeat-containing protein [Acidimicrobiia bacterium]|nr:cell wall-binding repeat-containing protein [Acidimicrobiia bacterium]